MSAPGRQPDWFAHVLSMRETIARIEARMDSIDGRMDRLEGRMGRLEAEVGALRRTLYTLHAAQIAGLLGIIAALVAQ